MTPALFTPIDIRSIRLRNRVCVAPMCQYSATEGMANDWHFGHLARFALGGFGLVMVEATAVERDGRISAGDLGLWNDAQVEPLARIARFLKSQGAAAGIQLAHAGRRASSRRPWEGGGPIPPDSMDKQGEGPWPLIAPSALPHRTGYPLPAAMTEPDFDRVRDAWRGAAQRALLAGFDVVEIHCAHGFLLNTFLSPISNKRNDEYGGDFEGRIRFPLEIISIVRDVWPQDKAVFVRVSATDWADGGWAGDDTILFADRLFDLGVDVVDCSSGGIAEPKTPLAPDYQTQFAARVHRETRMKSMAVGLISQPEAAEALLINGAADLVALGREALRNPNWPLHAQKALGMDPLDSGLWPLQCGYAVKSRL